MSKVCFWKKLLCYIRPIGFRYRYKDMRKEWTGALVGRDEFEPKQPQLGPFRKVTDPQALRDARPETGLVEERNIQWSWNPVGGWPDNSYSPQNRLISKGEVGIVTVETT